MITLGTVPHTGSHFVLEITGYENVSNPDRLNVAIAKNHPVCFFRHTYPGESMALLEYWGRRSTFVSPLRHPQDVAQSWKNRGKHIIDAPKGHHSMVSLFHNLFDLSERVNILFLPLDTKHRHKFLDRLSGRIGRRLRTNWKQVGHHPYETVPLTQSDLSAVDELMTHPLIERFYGTSD